MWVCHRSTHSSIHKTRVRYHYHVRNHWYRSRCTTTCTIARSWSSTRLNLHTRHADRKTSGRHYYNCTPSKEWRGRSSKDCNATSFTAPSRKKTILCSHLKNTFSVFDCSTNCIAMQKDSSAARIPRTLAPDHPRSNTTHGSTLKPTRWTTPKRRYSRLWSITSKPATSRISNCPGYTGSSG